MSLSSAAAQRRDLRPKRSLGQHFLKDATYLARMLEAAEVTDADSVLEIGPGTGALTAALVERGARVTAVELDERLVVYLAEKFADCPRVTIIQGDILEMDLSEIMGAGDYKVAANLPYYVTSAILRHILEAKRPPVLAAVMVQKEVAERICAQPDDMSLLAVSVRFYARPQLVDIVPAGAFYPRPKVSSAILRLDVYPKPAVRDVPPDRYFSVVRAGFSQRRKQLANSLSAGLAIPKSEVRRVLTESNIDPRRRPETLTLEEWRTVCLALTSH